MAISNIVNDNIVIKKQCKPREEELTGKPPPKGNESSDPMFMAVNNRRKLTIIKMEIMGKNLIDTIVDGGSVVNVLLKETWKRLEKPTVVAEL